MIHAFRTLADEASNAMALLDEQGRVIYANRTLASLFGAGSNPDALLETDWSALLTEETGLEFRERVLPAALCGGWEGDVRRWHREAKTAKLHVRVFPVPAVDAVALALVIAEPHETAAIQTLEASQEQPAAQPILPVADRIIVVPLVGILDLARSTLLMRSVLAGIRKHRAKAVIIDVTGLVEVDTRAADHLAKIVLAARLKGARTVVSGLSEQASEALTEIDADWRGIATVGDLRTALMTAFGYVGLTLRSISKGEH